MEGIEVIFVDGENYIIVDSYLGVIFWKKLYLFEIGNIYYDGDIFKW